MTDRSRLRLVVLQVLVLSLLITLLGRLWFLQINSGADYRAAATSNYERPVVTEAVRGQILDDMGRALVRNQTSLVVTVDRSTLDTMRKAKRAVVLGALAKQLHTTAKALADQITLCGTDEAKAAGLRAPVCWNGSPFQPIPVARGVSQQVALSILERSEDFPGVAAELEAERAYPAPYGANTAHELGYIGPVTDDEVTATKNAKNPLYRSDLVGRTGLEAEYDDVLRGVNGVKKLSVDRAGNVTGTLGETAAIAGNNLVTNIDARVQATLEKQLQVAMTLARSRVDAKTHKHFVADSAAGVVLDVTNGHVVAMASLPSYDPSIWVGGITIKEYDQLTNKNSGQPLVSRAYQGGFAPGSTFKVVSSTAMLQAGYSTAGPYECPSFKQFGTGRFENSESKSYGKIDLERAIEVSCDTVFYQVAYDQWVIDGGQHPIAQPKDIFLKAALAWGFGTKTGIDLPGESAGGITTRAERTASWLSNRAQYCADAKNGYPDIARTDPAHAAYLRAIAADNCSASGGVYRAGDAVNFIIGQGETLTTPLKMAQVYAAVANGGTLWTPQVAKAVVSPTGQVVSTIKPVAEGRVPVSKANLAFLQNALTNVSIKGTATQTFKGFPLAQIPIASKTGTAEVAGKQTTSWFASYAPANHPKYAVVIMVSQAGFGYDVSGPSVRAVYQALFGVSGATVDPKLSILPNAALPVKLPVFTADGTILPPGSVVPKTVGTLVVPGSPSGQGPAAPSSPAAPAALGPPGPVFASDTRRARGGGT